jgi:hypothetical protein
LNPKLPAGTVTVTEDIPAGVHEFTLQFPPLALVSSTDAAVVIANSQVAPTTVNSTGDFHRSGSTIYTFDATAGDTITYTLTPSVWGSGPNYTGGTFNVIPDLNQLEAGGDGCVAVLDGDGRYSITLPLCTHLSSNIGGTVIALTAADPLYNEQLILPRVLVDNYVSDEVIPGGFLYLRNWTTGEVYDDATYYYSANDTIIAGGIDLDDAIADGDLLAIVTVGTDITTTLDDLRQKFAYHKHDRSRGEMAIEAEDIVGWTKEEGASGPFIKSVMPGNYAPQYLHRDGFDSSDDGLNDNNVMRGDLGIGAEGAAAGAAAGTGTALDSWKIKFYGGDGSGGSQAGYIYVNDDGNMDLVAQEFIKPSTAMIAKLHNDTSVIADTGDTSMNARHFHIRIINSPYLVNPGPFTLGTYGFSSEQIISMQLLIKENTDDIWFPANDSATDGYYWAIHDYTAMSPWTLAIVLTGSNWSAPGDMDVVISGFYAV